MRRRLARRALAGLLWYGTVWGCGGPAAPARTTADAAAIDGTSGSDAVGSPDAPPGADGRSLADLAPPVPEASCRNTACAFPGAEGFGTGTAGGRGGPVLLVTTLANAGPGSLRAALLTPGPRIVVFAVSGVIDLGGMEIDLAAPHSRLTVLGQSSPGGITLVNGTLASYHHGLHDLILRFLRFRGATSVDNISLAGVSNLVIDHCDFSGGTDEAFDITFSRDFTVQWTTVTNSVRGSGSQNYGWLLAYRPTTNISLHHNFSAHHAGRCGAQFHWDGDGASPPPEGAAIDLRNNVFYNCAFQQIYREDRAPAGGNRWNLVGNAAVSGPDTLADSMLFGISGQVFVEGNEYPGQRVLTPFFSGTMLASAHPFPAVTTWPVHQAHELVLARAGAWPRDAMNARTVAEARSGGGTLGRNDDPLTTAGPPPPTDSDADGIADDWERAHGLDPLDRADSARLHASGYAHVEVYLDEVAQRIVGR